MFKHIKSINCKRTDSVADDKGDMKTKQKISKPSLICREVTMTITTSQEISRIVLASCCLALSSLLPRLLDLFLRTYIEKSRLQISSKDRWAESSDKYLISSIPKDQFKQDITNFLYRVRFIVSWGKRI